MTCNFRRGSRLLRRWKRRHAIRINGAIGAAQATALAFFVSFILTWFLSARPTVNVGAMRVQSEHY